MVADNFLRACILVGAKKEVNLASGGLANNVEGKSVLPSFLLGKNTGKGGGSS